MQRIIDWIVEDVRNDLRPEHLPGTLLGSIAVGFLLLLVEAWWTGELTWAGLRESFFRGYWGDQYEAKKREGLSLGTSLKESFLRGYRGEER